MKTRGFYSIIYFVLFFLFCSINYSQSFQDNQKFLSKVQSDNLARLGNWPFGQAIAVAVDTARDIVYLGSGGAVLILDVSDITNPQLLSDDINSAGLVLDLRYNPQTEHLYLASKYEGFQIWDVQNLTSPQLIIKYEFPFPYGSPPVYNVDFFENFVILDVTFVASIDVSNPNNPIYAGADASMGYTNGIHVDVDGNVHSTGSQTYVKLKLQPDGSFTGLYTYLDELFADPVFGVPDAAFVGDVQNLYLINTQSHIHPLWSYIYVGDSYDIYVQSDYAYLTVADQLKIYNVADYQNPYFEGSCTIPGYPNKLEVIDENAYLAGGFSGLRNINIQRPSEPIEVGFYETFSATSDMIRSGDYGFVAEMDDGMLVMDLTDLSNPTLIGQYNTPGISKSLEVEGNYAYIADRPGGLRIADIADPSNPFEVGVYDSLYSAEKLCVSNNYAYVVDDILNEPDWIRAINISDPTNPFQVGSILMQSDVNALDVSGNYLFAATTNTGLRVIDISDPTNLVEVSFFSAPNVYDVCVQDDYAYIASSDYNGGFITLDISDPIHPVFVSTFSRNGSLHPFDIALAGEYAYVTDPVVDEFLMLYIGNPAFPSELDYSKMSGDLFNIYAQDSLVYICDGRAGLHIFKNELYSTPGGGITWQQQNSGTNNDLWSVSFANTNMGWAAGENGVIIKTTNGGQAWSQKQSGNTNELFSIFFVDENTGWAAGREGTILKSTDGGESWQQQVSGTTDVFRSIYFTNENNGWAVGQHGTIMNTANGGKNWQPQSSGISDYLLQVDFVDVNTGWVVGQNGIILNT
ncbi:MAG: YCF48-related protein, partial [Chlorobium sp.]|nr:YCF48-related protein [Chlorobium sp.]